MVLYENYKKMKIPLQTEVAKYMEEKKGWPQKFCLYYAEKFWSHYQARGWKLSDKNPMKDWQAAFNAQWQNLKFDEDKIKLKEYSKVNLKDMDKVSAIAYLDTILMTYKNGLKPDRESAFKLYEYIKSMGWMKLPKEAIEECRVKAGSNMDNAKLFALQFFLDRMVNNGLTFKKLYGN